MLEPSCPQAAARQVPLWRLQRAPGIPDEPVPPPTTSSWSSLTDLLPYLLEFRARIAIALVCLVAAKLASVGLPFVLKDIVDQLDTKTSQTWAQKGF